MEGRRDRLRIAFNYLKEQGLIKNQKDLAAKMKTSQANISFALKGTESYLTNNFLLRFNNTFDNIFDFGWLANGDGEAPSGGAPDSLYNKKEEGNFKLIPLINIDSVGGMDSFNTTDFSEQYVEKMIPLPDVREGDVAIHQSGESMSPVIPSGALLHLRQVENWQEYFGYGGDFVLWLDDDRRITKQVLRSEEDPRNFVLCHSYNPQFADEELPRSMIKQVWRVVKVLINKSW